MKGLRFEPLDERHIPAVVAIEALSNPAPWSERSFLGELTNRQSLFLVALSGAEVVGYAGLWQVVDEAHVTTLAVAPEHRRMGIGRRLITELLHRAAERGMECSTLEARADNEPALRLYEQLGFIRTARRKGYYPDRQDAVVMWLHDLRGGQLASKAVGSRAR